jgi:elongation factor P--(R)-beta-lysine ligase
VIPEREGERADVVYSPHQASGDLALQGQRIRVGGRVLVEASRARLADALGTLDLELAGGAMPGHGVLALLIGTLEGQRLLAAEVLHEQPSAAHPADFERLFHGGLGQRLVQRAQILAEVRRFFDEQGFLELDTPQRSHECGTEVHVEPLAVSGGYLIPSPELHMKRLLVAGLPRLFQLVHCFRAGELGALHGPEFSMLEWYRAFAGWHAMLHDTEQLVYRLCRRFQKSSFLELGDGRRIDVTPPFVRLSVREAFARFAGVSDAVSLAERDEDQYFQVLVDSVEPKLAAFERPVFLHDYPASQAALARLCPHDPSVAERFELYVGGIELCNGYGELNAAAEQRARCEADRERRRQLGRHVPDLPLRFLAALEQGMPPASGNALGLERLIMLLTNQSRIDASQAFPDSIA